MFWKSLKSIALVIEILVLVIVVSGTAGAQEARPLEPPPEENSDFGDAPLDYPPAKHRVQLFEWLGPWHSHDGLHGPNWRVPGGWGADTYDDGVTWGTPIIPGSPWSITFEAKTLLGDMINVEIWVDWNDDEVWDPTEKVVDWYGWVKASLLVEGTIVTHDLIVPSNVASGTELGIRARLAYRGHWGGWGTGWVPDEAGLSPTGVENWGEVEDYLTDPVEGGGVVPVELSSFTASTKQESVVLRWITGSETENLGYHVYRSLMEDGEYQKITPALIEGGGSSRTTRAYQFVDRNVQPGARYFYKLEQLDFDGTKETYGPVVGKATVVQASTWGAVKSLLR